MGITRRRFLAASAVAIPGAVTTIGRPAEMVALAQQVSLSGQAVSLPSNSPIVAAGILRGSPGTCLFQATRRVAGGFNFTAEFPNGVLQGFVHPLAEVAECSSRPGDWNGFFTRGLGGFAGLTGTFSLSTTPLQLANLDRSVPVGFTLQLNGSLA